MATVPLTLAGSEAPLALDPVAKALALNARAAEQPLYRSKRDGVPEARHTSWRITPEPVALPAGVLAQLEGLGGHLLAFTKALNELYLDSVKGKVPAWVAELLDAGKPEAVVTFQRMKRLKGELPRVIRPDLVVDESGRLVACELDSVPGGLGQTSGMAADHAALGGQVLGGAEGIVEQMAAMLRDAAGQEDPFVAIVVSDEGEDYRAELTHLAERLRAIGLRAVCMHPKALVYDGEGFLDAPGGTRIDLIYRFFELFDLANVPKAELMMYAYKKQQVAMTPPPKAYMEEKLSFALYHHPALRPWWKANLSAESLAALDSLLPETWVVDPTPVPPQAGILGLMPNGLPLTDWRQLADLPKKERAFVLKPSGFSKLAWGSHGVAFGHDLSAEDWKAALENAMAAFPKQPYILQRYTKPVKMHVDHYDFVREAMRTVEGRMRLCPYYLVVGDEARLGGALVTVAPPDKLAIHGMVDAVMAPASALPAKAPEAALVELLAPGPEAQAS